MITDFRALCVELLGALADQWVGDERPDPDVVIRARAALAAPQQGATSDLAPPINLWDGTTESQKDCIFAAYRGGFKEALTRYGAHPAPMPVAERLPGEGDCAPWSDDPDTTHWCWAAKEVDGGWEWAQLSMLGLGTDALGRIIAGGGWTHWLPYWALPLPQEGQP